MALATALCILLAACATEPDLPERYARQPAAPTMHVVLAGDSIMEALGPVLAERLEELGRRRGIAGFVQAGRSSSGLCRPDFHDWPARMRGLVADGRAGLVAFCIGTNDDQSVAGPDGRRIPFGARGWDAAYAAKVEEIIDIVAASGAAQAWLSPPVMREPLGARVRVIMDIIRRTCESRGVPYIDIWNTLADSAGQYRRDAVGPDGARIVLRARDGVHVMRDGNERLADAVAPRLLDILDARQGAREAS